MKLAKLLPLFALLLILALLPSISVTAPDRGVRVALKASEAPGAADAGEVTLYSASYALVIGIDKYTGGWPRLSGAVKDAQLVSQTLRTRQGFEVTFRADLKGEELEKVLKEFFVTKGADKDARLFIWFAGHGHTLGGEGFIVPVDAPRPSNETGFKMTALSMRRFGELMRLASSKHVLAVFDSCFSGTVFDTERAIPPAAVTRATTLPVREYVSSGDADQTVSDNGNFRELFLRALNGEEYADANHDGYLTGSELGNYLCDRVTNLTSGRQTPKYGKLRDMQWDRGDFVFVTGAPAVLQGQAAPLPQPSSTEIASGAMIKEEPGDGATRLSVKCDISGARVYVDGRDLGPAPISGVSVKPGERRVEVKKAGYEPYSTLISPEKGDAISLDTTLTPLPPKPGKLYVDVNPAEAPAAIEIKGLGRAYSRGMAMDPGTYDVKVTAQGFADATARADIGSGEGKYVTIRLIKYVPPKQGEIKIIDLGNGVALEMVWIEGGTFMMGSKNGGFFGRYEKPVHQVGVSGFWMGRTEVTQAQYQAITGGNPSRFQGSNLPVEQVSWHDSAGFCESLSQKTGENFRLPTEAEWEYACRAGSDTDYCFGKESTLDAYAWYNQNSGGTTHPVGRKQPNAWGLYDMHGNVWEWCGDWYASNFYAKSPKENPAGPSTGTPRVIRGGSWGNNAGYCRSAFRHYFTPGYRNNSGLGFRVVSPRIP